LFIIANQMVLMLNLFQN